MGTGIDCRRIGSVAIEGGGTIGGSGVGSGDGESCHRDPRLAFACYEVALLRNLAAARHVIKRPTMGILRLVGRAGMSQEEFCAREGWTRGGRISESDMISLT